MQQLEYNWNAELYNDKHSFVYDYGVSLVNLLDAKPGQRILDVGCGSGELSDKISQSSADVVGIDSSPSMIKKAQGNFPSCKFHLGDASNFTFDNKFDAIFSNAALHWVVDYKKAIRCMYAVLKSNGRFVVEFGGKGNVSAIIEQLRKSLYNRGYLSQAELNLWYFPSIAEYSSELELAGFKVRFAELYDRPTILSDSETGIKDWLSMFAKPFFTEVSESVIGEILNEVQESLRSVLFKDGNWFADYKRIRIVAYR